MVIDSFRLITGEYGEVHLCEFTPPGADTDQSSLVAVKMLQVNVQETAKNDFYREIRIMSRLRHDNIVQVRGAGVRGGLQVQVMNGLQVWERGAGRRVRRKGCRCGKGVPICPLFCPLANNVPPGMTRTRYITRNCA